MPEPPDPRFLLANERTFLAWVRTSLALLAAAAAVTAVDLPVSSDWQRVMSIVLATIALISCLQGWRSWRRREAALHRHEPLPSLRGGQLLRLGLVVVAVMLIIFAAGLTSPCRRTGELGILGKGHVSSRSGRVPWGQTRLDRRDPTI